MSTVKVKVKQTGFKSEIYLQKMKNIFTYSTFRSIANESLKDFIKASPTFDISINWSYDIEKKGNHFSLIFNNSTFENGENIAILVDIGHGTVSGNWVPGKNYLREPINNTYKRINKLIEEAQ